MDARVQLLDLDILISFFNNNFSIAHPSLIWVRGRRTADPLLFTPMDACCVRQFSFDDPLFVSNTFGLNNSAVKVNSH